MQRHHPLWTKPRQGEQLALFVIGMSSPSYPSPALEETCGDGPEDEAGDMSRVCHSAGRLLRDRPEVQELR
jgi:hypothetical protein